MQYQVTIFCESKKYKPVSTIVDMPEGTVRQIIMKKGIEKICLKRLWDGKDLAKYGYTKVKVREYDKEKIAQENEERYNKIKEDKYASGEWKRPQKKEG